MDTTQSLVSQRSSDSGLHIQLHPLVLLSISDHITRHAARQQQGPIIGALLGQQNGREITLEHVFECQSATSNGETLLNTAWFEERVKQFKDVHKEPPLDIVGWWSTAPPTGPSASHLPLHQQILQNYNESAVFLAFHPSQLQSTESHAAKLPLTIFETVFEGDNADNASKDMQIDGEEPKLSLRFRELPYSVETGEAEMIGVDTIAKSSLTASWTEPTPKSQNENQATDKSKTQPKQQAELSNEEEELIGNLNTRLNAIRTLESRISLVKSYVASVSEPDADGNSATTLSHPIIRNINSLLSHLSILTPSGQKEFSTEVLSQNNDVLLASVLGQMGENVKAARELGRNSAVVNSARQANNSRKPNASRYEEELFSGQLRQSDGFNMYA